MSSPVARFGRAPVARGFSLIELMVALAIGMVIMLALLVVLINVNRTNTEMVRSNSVIENGRFTLQLLETDLSHAGFWAGFVPQFDDTTLTLGTAPTDAPASIPDPCLSYSAANWNQAYLNALIGVPVQVYEVSSAGAVPTIGTCASAPTSLSLANAKANTHVLVVRHLAPCTAGTSTDEDCTMQSGDVYFQLNRCAVSPAYIFTAATDASLSNFTLTNRNCSTVADRYKYVSHIYWIRNYASTAGDGIPTLMRSTFRQVAGTLKHDTSDALVEGIEGFRVDLGIDNVSRSGATLAASDFSTAVCWDATCSTSPTELRIAYNRGDGSPDTYVQCTQGAACTLLQLMNVATAKVTLLVRAPTTASGYSDGKAYTMGTGTNAITLGPFNDGYKRHLYTQAIRMTNISTRRELAP